MNTVSDALKRRMNIRDQQKKGHYWNRMMPNPVNKAAHDNELVRHKNRTRLNNFVKKLDPRNWVKRLKNAPQQLIINRISR